VQTYRHEPDAVFEHLEAQYPGVVIEASFTQKRKDLPRLADSYILGSDGNSMRGCWVGYRIHDVGQRQI
jgi:hypothetical protein